MPISVELEIVLIQFVGKAPHSHGHNNLKVFEKPTDPIGVEDCNYYQTSYSIGFKYFHIKLGLTSPIETNTYKIEFPNYPLSLSSPSSASISRKSNTSLLKGRMRLGGGDRASAKTLASSAAYEGSSNVLEGLEHMPRRSTAFSTGTLNPQASRLETRRHMKMGKIT